MLKEHFKRRIHITSLSKDAITYNVDMAMYEHMLSREALDDIIVPSEEHSFSAEDKIFFMPGCSVPRFKVKQLCDATGMSVVKSPDNANVVIVGDESSRKITYTEYHNYSVTKDNMLDWLNKNYPVAHPQALALKRLLNMEDTFDIVTLNDWQIKGIMTKAEKDFPHPLKDNAMSSRNFWKSEEKTLTDFEKIMDKEIKLVHQRELLAILNMGKEMDFEMYEEACKMLDSEDANNHVLAMEMMANCDYEKSAVYLLSLLSQFYSQINSRKEKDHVNFKSLLAFFELDNIYISFDEIVNMLINKNYLGSTELEVLCQIKQKNLMEEFNSELNAIEEDETEQIQYFKATVQVGPTPALLKIASKIDAERQLKNADQQETTPEKVEVHD